jgi:hypothetical protein
MDMGLYPRLDCGTHLWGPHAEHAVDMHGSGQCWVDLGIRHYLVAVCTLWSADGHCLFGFHNRSSRLLILHQELDETQTGCWGTEQLQEQLHSQGCGENKHW